MSIIMSKSLRRFQYGPSKQRCVKLEIYRRTSAFQRDVYHNLMTKIIYKIYNFTVKLYISRLMIKNRL